MGETFDLTFVCVGGEGGGAAVLVAVIWEIGEAFELRAFVCVWYCGWREMVWNERTWEFVVAVKSQGRRKRSRGVFAALSWQNL